MTPLARTAILLVAIAMSAVGCGLSTAPSASPTDAPAVVIVTPSPEPTPSPTVPPLPTDSPAPSDLPSPSPSPSPSAGQAAATRIVIDALGIDLPVVKSPPAGVYPYCNVAMSFGKPMGQPGGNRATYLFAHARDGMFGPIYKLVMVKRTPNKMVGMLVDVYTSDSMLHVYKIVQVLPHERTLARAVAVSTDQLWLQTSEGPHGTIPKTQVVADPVSVAPAGYAASHPKPHIVRCG
jgi:hypothetical protein